jgi:hypothetical protein
MGKFSAAVNEIHSAHHKNCIGGIGSGAGDHNFLGISFPIDFN